MLTGGLEKPEERQQSHPGRQLKPKSYPKLNPVPIPMPRTTSTLIALMTSVPTLARRFETVPPPNEKKLATSAPAPTTGSRLADRRIILRRDGNMPLPNKMDKEILSVINRALFHRQAPVHILIMNAIRNANYAIKAITHQNATAEMGQLYHDIIIMAVRTVDKGVINVNKNESWQRLKIHAVPLVLYMRKGTDGLHEMRDEFDAESEGVAITAQVRWVANPPTIRESRQNGENAASSVVLVVKGNKVVQPWVMRGIKVDGVW